MKALGGTAGAVIATELQQAVVFALPSSNEGLVRQGYLRALFNRLRVALVAAAGPLSQKSVFCKQLQDYK